MKTGIRRWLVYLWLLLPTEVAPGLMISAAGFWGFLGNRSTWLAISFFQNALVALLLVALATALVLDYRESKRYPWTHWFGALTHALFPLVWLLDLAWPFLSPLWS